ncbi:glycoside hydrolase family 7 protein [Myriangium duriaei CBS 260.36]|uniref:Glucanase n=1 Tax=Myriangium duriaei CBS 260.36 TaxID=1168546 RepID=A0A9P4IWP6_9PEZI|nr:glycoside hydrolase family 7 protein [Myriangium duriaei CBS 260.36]
MQQSMKFALVALLAKVYAQQAGTNTAENHPKLTTQTCTKSGCTTNQNSIVLDANWRWLHTTSGYTNCYTGQTWDKTLCPDPTTCATNCALDGADYSGTYGITTSGNALTLKFVTGSNVGSRVYLMDPTDSKYQLFNMKNQEFTFDVDVSQLPCGLNGALYFVNMPADGGLAKYSGNKAGAKYGTGYCDSQCPQDIKFIGGQANILNWVGSSNDPNTGTGQWGSCCSEFDVWEANSISSAFTPHPCKNIGQTKCTTAADCGAGSNRYTGQCDKDGCDFNSYREGNTTFYGPGKTIDTTKKITVVTQFITADGTASGALSQIKRLWVQGGKVIQNSNIDIAGVPAVNSLTDSTCAAQKKVFGDTNSFASAGGMAQMGKAFADSMVLVMSIWDDHAANMLWLDSSYPTTADATKPGVKRGTCGTDSGVPATVEGQTPNAQVTFSNIKTGPLGTTYTS